MKILFTVQCDSSGSRRGSALLIVLGFLSFMVVSAVSFSIYMRSERMPSSVFRRDVQARHLMKAALARAMSEIDDAIREDPFAVGVERGWAVRVGSGSSSPSGSGLYETSWMAQYERQTRTRYFNRWMGRVFMPPNPDNESDYGLMAPYSQTTPVLNLEALGYLPPPVMNDARILSRGSWTAKWKNLDYGAGRYAYCAVDVSDFLDINRIAADTPRTSQDRINFAHLFASDRSVDNGISASEINTFADFIHDNRGNESSLKDYPFVSMMDYNLALGGKGEVSKFKSPFYLWLGKSTSPADFYADMNGGNPTATTPEWLRCKNSVFITDSWLPQDTVSYQLDISGNGREPFLRSDVENANRTLDDIARASTDFTRFFVRDERLLTELDKCSLYDYLDRDNVPLSLCLPCVERVPMVTAIQPDRNFGFKIQVQPGTPVTSGGTGPAAPLITTTEYKFGADVVAPNASLNVAIAFPFRHGRNLNGGSFRAKAFVRVYLAELPTNARYRNNNFSFLRPPDDDQDWDPRRSDYGPFKLGGRTDVLAFTLVSDIINFNLPSSVDTDGDIVLNLPGNGKFMFTQALSQLATGGQTFFTKRETQQYTAPGVPATTPPVTEWKLNIKPYSATGTPVDDGITVDPNGFMADADFQGLATRNLYPCLAVWVRIENANGDVVDMVPAMPKDDILNTGDNTAALIWTLYPNLRPLKDSTPYLLFPNSEPYTLQVSLNGTAYDRLGNSGKWTPEALYNFDPRFNFAPEDWYGMSYEANLGDKWLDVIDGELGTAGRDSDPFLFVSNQGYLQSIAELAFLPRLSDFRRDDNSVNSLPGRPAGTMGSLGTVQQLVSGYDGELHTLANLSSLGCMWKSYRVYPLADDRYGSDGLFNLDKVTDGGHGFRVDSYTTLTNVMFAAVANTPYDWWAAGTNKVNAGGANANDVSAKQNQLSSLDNSLKYAFNESGGGNDTRLEYRDLRKIATFLMRRFEEAAASGQHWLDMFDNLDWSGNLGQNLGQLYNDNVWQSGTMCRKPIVRHQADASCSSDPFKAEIQDYGSDSDLGGGTSSSFYDNLTSADRKFLYSFWRGCFAHRQQLFLVFLKAESTTMGGSGEGQIAAQQGGRAVALVWRDPNTPNNQTGNPRDDFIGWIPHRMRVLFYHQFE